LKDDYAVNKGNTPYCLGGVVKAARLESHLTQRELSERLKITPHYLMSIENKQRLPSCDLLFRIIRELEIPADTVFYPEYGHNNVSVKKLQILLNKCDEQDITVILATLQSLIQTKKLAGGD
jgi:transcriptional regulator with XRE-family HTH domain